MSIPLAETNPLDRLVGYTDSGTRQIPGHLYTLFAETDQLEILGARAEKVLNQTSIQVMRGIGVAADVMGDSPHVLLELNRHLTKKAVRRLGEAGLELVPGRPQLH